MSLQDAAVAVAAVASRREGIGLIDACDSVDAGTRHAPAAARIALLGTGAVGRALLARLEKLGQSQHLPAISLVRIANSRGARSHPHGLDLPQLRHDPAVAGTGSWNPDERHTPARATPDPCITALGCDGNRLIIDATASDAVAAQHAHWLAQGVHVVTACKLGQGTSLARWRAIGRARREAGSCYGDAATVGAGLPMLRTVRALRAGGDRVHEIAGVLSGSLAWLFAAFDGSQPFSSLLRQARERGYTEPDPRDDLSGADVARKLIILLRCAGIELDSDAIKVEPLSDIVSESTSTHWLDALDHDMHARLDAAQRAGHCLRYVARFDPHGARVGLEQLPLTDPLALASGCDNRLVLWTDRYRDSPLVIQGPGAGAEVTAAALLDDVLRIIAGVDTVA